MLISTRSAVYRLHTGGGQREPELLFEGPDVAGIAEKSDVQVVALSDGDVVSERRRIPTGVLESISSLLILRGEPLELLIGTQGAHLYRLIDDGRPARRIEPFERLPCRRAWHAPSGGRRAIRSLAGTADGWVYGDIHVGGVVRSGDFGESWEPVSPELDEDVHQVVTCPSDCRRVYANTGRGVYVSRDRGESWQHRATGLGGRYGRAIAVCSGEPDRILATVSDGPRGGNVHGRLYLTADGGATWRHVSAGFPASTSRNIDTFHVGFAPDGVAWAVVGAALYRGEDGGSRWEPFWRAPQSISVIACS